MESKTYNNFHISSLFYVIPQIQLFLDSRERRKLGSSRNKIKLTLYPQCNNDPEIYKLEVDAVDTTYSKNSVMLGGCLKYLISRTRPRERCVCNS